MSKELFIHEWMSSSNALLKRAKAMLESAPSEKIRNLSRRVADRIATGHDTVQLVFAGQYNAGKSSLLTLLTGQNDIAVGGGITTQKTSSYDWNGITVIDTPGVHTELRKDHDDIAYQAIADADLVAFVLTNEGFDSHLAKHFQKLAIEKGKAHEMMLIVNKMQRTALGNKRASHDIFRSDVEKVLTPFTPEELRITFVDAKSAFESKEEEDEEFAQNLWRKGGVDSLIQHLNDFIKDKAVVGRNSTALYALEQVLQEALSSECSGDKDVDALEELLLQRRRALVETQFRIPQAVESEIQRTSSEIRQLGRSASEQIHGRANEQHIKDDLEKKQHEVDTLSENLGNAVQRAIEKQIEGFDERVDAIANSELARELMPRLEKRITDTAISSDAMSKLQKGSELSSAFGGFLVKNSFISNGGNIFRLNQYSGTATHNMVKTIGKRIGKKFKPWEAIKWTRGVANAGRIFAGIGTVVSIGLQIKEDVDAEQAENDLRSVRSDVRAGFNEAAHVIETYYDEKTKTYISETFSPQIKLIDNQVTELRGLQSERSELFAGLLGLLGEVKYAINQVHTI